MKEVFVSYQAFSQGGGILFGNKGFLIEDNEELSLTLVKQIQGSLKEQLIAARQPLVSDVTIMHIMTMRTGVTQPATVQDAAPAKE